MRINTFFKYVNVAAVTLWVILTPPAYAQEGPNKYTINKIEAAYMYNFIDFIKWPASNHPSGKLTIGILGHDPFGDAFAEVEGTTILGKTLVVKKSDRIEELLDSWILFIASSEKSRIQYILESIGHRPILTVGDMDEFIQAGGMIQFYQVEINGDIKVRFDINKERINKAGLTVSYQLLSLARPKP